jgi:hypothetical protein
MLRKKKILFHLFETLEKTQMSQTMQQFLHAYRDVLPQDSFPKTRANLEQLQSMVQEYRSKRAAAAAATTKDAKMTALPSRPMDTSTLSPLQQRYFRVSPKHLSLAHQLDMTPLTSSPVSSTAVSPLSSSSSPSSRHLASSATSSPSSTWSPPLSPLSTDVTSTSSISSSPLSLSPLSFTTSQVDHRRATTATPYIPDAPKAPESLAHMIKYDRPQTSTSATKLQTKKIHPLSVLSEADRKSMRGPSGQQTNTAPPYAYRKHEIGRFIKQQIDTLVKQSLFHSTTTPPPTTANTTTLAKDLYDLKHSEKKTKSSTSSSSGPSSRNFDPTALNKRYKLTNGDLNTDLATKTVKELRDICEYYNQDSLDENGTSSTIKIKQLRKPSLIQVCKNLIETDVQRRVEWFLHSYIDKERTHLDQYITWLLGDELVPELTEKKTRIAKERSSYTMNAIVLEYVHIAKRYLETFHTMLSRDVVYHDKVSVFKIFHHALIQVFADLGYDDAIIQEISKLESSSLSS